MTEFKTKYQLYKHVVIEWLSKSSFNNSIRPHWVQYILRYFYYTAMQKLCNFEAISRPENQCNSKYHKGSP